MIRWQDGRVEMWGGRWRGGAQMQFLREYNRVMRFEYFSALEGSEELFKGDHRAVCAPQDVYEEMYFGEEEAKCTIETSKMSRGKRGKASEGRRTGEGHKNGHWDTEENKRYHWFLQIHSTHFINKQMRRMDKIFKSMARFVGSREAEQCRSHHQKMEKKFHTFSMIIRHLRVAHYYSYDEAPVLRDILANDVACTNAILPFEELKGLEARQSTVKEIVSPTLTQDTLEEKVQSRGDPIQELLAQEEHDSFLCNVFG